jgi:phosphate-selective porin OprO/OprP
VSRRIATIPILADGVKWLGYVPRLGLIWNLGMYVDWLSEGQTFSTYRHQIAGRLARLPVMSEETVLHVGQELRLVSSPATTSWLRTETATGRIPRGMLR